LHCTGEQGRLTSEKLYHPEDDISFEERDKVWSLIYSKILEAIKKRQNFAILFSGALKEKGEGYSAIITDDQYQILLENFLLWSEEQERYEICLEVKKLIKELEQWKKKI
jgi:hypothetical protein